MMKNKCKIKIGFFAVIMLICLLAYSPDYFPALTCSVIIHEAGHVAMARLLGIRLYELRLGIFGAALSPQNLLYSYKDEIALCLGGPLFNFASAAFIGVVFTNTELFELFVASSLALGALNMLPIIGFDGGRILYALICATASVRTAEIISKLISFIFIFVIWSFSVYLLLRTGASVGAYVFSISLFAKIFLPHEV